MNKAQQKIRDAIRLVNLEEQMEYDKIMDDGMKNIALDYLTEDTGNTIIKLLTAAGAK